MGRRTKVTRQDTADFGLKSESLTSSPLFLPVSRGELGEVSTKEADLRRRGPRGLSHEAALQRVAARRTQGSRALVRPLAPPPRSPAPRVALRACAGMRRAERRERARLLAASAGCPALRCVLRGAERGFRHRALPSPPLPSPSCSVGGARARPPSRTLFRAEVPADSARPGRSALGPALR